MHELGVVFYVVRDVKKIAEENKISKVNSVTLEIGEVSGIINEYLEDCFNWAAKKEPVLAEAKLKIEDIKAVTFCEDCKQEYDTVTYAKICPYCKSEHTYLLRGNEFNIKEIEVFDEEEAENSTKEQKEIAKNEAMQSDSGVENEASSAGKVLGNGMEKIPE